MFKELKKNFYRKKKIEVKRSNVRISLAQTRNLELKYCTDKDQNQQLEESFFRWN